MVNRVTLWAGIAFSAVFLAVFALLFVDLDTLVEVMRNANYAYIVPGLILYTVGLWLRTVRWRLILNQIDGNNTARALFPVVVVGYMANNLIPVRVGELVRAYYLSLRETVGVSAGVGTIMLERASDVIVLMFYLVVALIGSAALVGSALPLVAEQVPGGMPLFAFLALLPLLGVLAVVSYTVFVSAHQTATIMAKTLWFLPSAIKDRLVAIALNLLSGLSAARTPMMVLKIVAISILIWAAEIGMYYVIALGFDIRAAFDNEIQFVLAIVFFGSMANLAGVIPSSAGGWGSFHFFGAASLVALGLNDDVAAGYALTVHMALWAPVTIAGAAFLFADGTSLGRLARGIGHLRRDRQATAPAEIESSSYSMDGNQ